MEPMGVTTGERIRGIRNLALFVALILAASLLHETKALQKLFFTFDDQVIVCCTILPELGYEPQIKVTTDGKCTTSYLTDRDPEQTAVVASADCMLTPEEVTYLKELAREAYFSYDFKSRYILRGHEVVNIKMNINDKECDFGMCYDSFERWPIFKELTFFLMEHATLPINIKQTEDGTYYME